MNSGFEYLMDHVIKYASRENYPALVMWHSNEETASNTLNVLAISVDIDISL